MSWQIAGILMLIAGILEYAIWLGPKVFAFVYRVVGPYGAQGGTAVLVFVCGIAAHWFKRKNQRWYGRVEVLVGALSGIRICFSLAPHTSMFSQSVALVGCAYVIARGLNNITEANGKRPMVTVEANS